MSSCSYRLQDVLRRANAVDTKPREADILSLSAGDIRDNTAHFFQTVTAEVTRANSSNSESLGEGSEHSPSWNESPQTPDGQSTLPNTASDRAAALSLGAKQYCAAVRSEYRRGFVRAFYTALRRGCPVVLSDFQRALAATESFLDEVR